MRHLSALQPLPEFPWDPSDRHLTSVSSLSLIRYRTDYSVTVEYGYKEVLVRGYVDEVIISCGTEVMARHRRSDERDGFVFDRIHFLPYLEHKTAAENQGAPLTGWDLHDEFGILHRSWSRG